MQNTQVEETKKIKKYPVTFLIMLALFVGFFFENFWFVTKGNLK